MTTAHRPTWNAASGRNNDYGYWSSGGQVSKQFSALDLPGHTKLKFRQPGQGTVEELQQKDQRAELEKKELDERQLKQKYLNKYATPLALEDGSSATNGGGSAVGGGVHTKLQIADINADVDEERVQRFNDADASGDDSESDFSSDEDDDDDDEDEDDDEEEEEALQRELDRIRKEREDEKRKKEEEERLAKQEAEAEIALTGNPLLNSANTTAGANQGGETDGKLKRKWNDDVVFRNQARGAEDSGGFGGTKKKRFINDTIRNDFHRKFLSKYIV